MLKETVKWFNKEKGFGVIIFSNTVISEWGN
ncbi:cold shock domain-containing protein [Cetobacterium somerae]|nr:cold shock domain-containing protein [Cetobacterium somerae]